MVLAHDITKGSRTKDVKITQNITFETMLLAPETLKGLKESGFHKPSPIQLYGIPIGKCGFDLLLEAKSGTGKTAVFSIIALEKLDFCKGLQVVILTPTREIAAQICDVLRQIGCMYKDLQIEVVMGGLSLQDDIDKFKKPVHIVVGSPGRLKHLIRNKSIDLKSVRLLVLDEADKLMESGFQSDIKFIHMSLPKQKQVIMSSATYPECSRSLINTFVQNPSHVCPDSDCVLLGIKQKVSFVKYNSSIIKYTQDKYKELNKILGRLQFKQCLVFCNYQVRVTEVHEMLRKAEWPSEKLYGQQEQVDRLDALKTLQQYKCRILVSTDLAARGIDASNIDLVINFEPPYDWQTYLHRIGRAGRFGSYGLAINILSDGKEQQKFREMLRLMNLPITMHHLWSDEEFNINDTAPPKPDQDQCNMPSDETTSTEVTEQMYCKEMWELLSDKSNTINCIETFDSLCNLNENSDIPKIEQFSDLLLSLEDKDSQETEEHVMFKHIEMRKTTNPFKILRNSTTEMDTVEKSNGGNFALNIDDNKGKLRAASCKVSDNTNDDNNNATINEKDENHEINKTMLKLNLPITFSSSKFKTYNRKHKINKLLPHNNTYRNPITNYNSLNDIPLDRQENTEIQIMNGEVSHDEDDIENEIEQRDQTKVNKQYDETNNYYDKAHSYNNAQRFKYSRSVDRKFRIESYDREKESAKLYNNWYNQLKMRMKYIEQAVYIDEMTKF